MNIIIDGITYNLVKTDESDDTYSEYDVYNEAGLIGRITKHHDIEVVYSGWNVNGEHRGSGKTIREALESMILHIFFQCEYKGERYIITLGTWQEGSKVKVEYDRNNIVKHEERVVRYSGAAGDLYITIDNKKYFYCEFE